MSIGPFADFDACLTGMAARYPDEATRRKVCGALKARLEAKPLQEASPVALVEADALTTAAVVEEGPGYWLVRNVTATREGVSIGRKVLKRREAMQQTSALLDGAPVIYGLERHLSGDLEPDPRTAPGFAVNARFEGDAVVYDAVLWAANPEGHAVTPADLELNRAFVAAVREGAHVHNSLGTLGVERMATGKAAPMGGGAHVAYESEQVQVLKVGHVAILSPVATGRGSCPAPACGAIPQEASALAESLGVRRAAVLIAAAKAARSL